MNDPCTSPQPMLYPLPNKRTPIVPIILGIFGLLVVLAVAGGIKAFRAVKEGSAQAIRVGNRFIDAMGSHNYQRAYALFTPQVQAHTSADNLKDVEALVEKHHGTLISHGKPQWNIQNWNGQTSVRLAYPAQFTKNTSTISMTLVQTANGYQVYDVHYEF